MYEGGDNGARARSARIRSAHDYEATTLDSMRRRAQALQEQPAPSRRGLVRAVLTLGRRQARRHELERETLALSD